MIIYFWKDLVKIAGQFIQGIYTGAPFANPNSRLGWYLVLATIPAGLAALIFKETFEQAFSSPRAAAIFLLVTSGLLIAGELIGKRTRDLKSINWIDSLVIGLFQVLALFPGLPDPDHAGHRAAA